MLLKKDMPAMQHKV